MVKVYLTKDMEKMKNSELKNETLKLRQHEFREKARENKSVAIQEYALAQERERKERIRRITRELNNASRSSTTIMMIVFMGLCLSVALGCSEISTFSVDNNACSTSSSGTTTCTVKQSMILSAAPVGQYACFNVNSPDGKPMGSIQVKFTAMNIKCIAYKLYYVPDVRPWPTSYFRCDSAGDCNANQCNHVQANPDVLDSIAYVQDHSGMRIKGGCSFIPADGILTSDGCAYSQGCLYWSVALYKASSRIIEQTACSSWEFVMDTEISFLNMQNSFSSRHSLIPGSPTRVNENLHISLISASVPPTSLTNMCIGKSDRLASIYECNKKDSLIPGLIGELQCPTETAASSLRGCYASAASFETTVNSKGLVVNSKLIDVWKVFNQNALPYRLSNGITVYQTADKEIYTTFPGTALTQIALTIDNMRLTYVSTKSTCTITSVSLKGCFSCINGADWKFIGRTDFGTAVATIKCPSINFITIISLKESSTESSMKITMNSGDIDANCVVECPGGSTNFVLRGTLDWIPPEDPRDNSTATGTANTPGSSDIWGQAWKIISKFVYWTIGIICLIIFIILTILFVKNVLIPFMKLSKSKKSMEKMV